MVRKSGVAVPMLGMAIMSSGLRTADVDVHEAAQMLPADWGSCKSPGPLFLQKLNLLPNARLAIAESTFLRRALCCTLLIVLHSALHKRPVGYRPGGSVAFADLEA